MEVRDQNEIFSSCTHMHHILSRLSKIVMNYRNTSKLEIFIIYYELFIYLNLILLNKILSIFHTYNFIVTYM